VKAPVPDTALSLSSDGPAHWTKFHLATVIFRRAAQLRQGARPRVDARGHNVVRVAGLEVLAGVIAWHLDGPTGEEPA
jgi:DNA-directed RNA polymerase subunit K/omega